MTAIYVALVIYMVVLFGVGLFYSKKNATINDFLLAGRDLGVVAATLTVTASLFGGGLLTGSAQYAYDSGPMMYVYGIVGSGGGLLLAALLGLTGVWLAFPAAEGAVLLVSLRFSRSLRRARPEPAPQAITTALR